MGNCSILDAEFWGIENGKLTILLRSQEVIQAIQSNSTKSSNSALVKRIQLLLAKMVHWSIHNISQEYNKEVDRLATMTIDNNSSLQFFEMLSKELGHISR